MKKTLLFVAAFFSMVLSGYADTYMNFLEEGMSWYCVGYDKKGTETGHYRFDVLRDTASWNQNQGVRIEVKSMDEFIEPDSSQYRFNSIHESIASITDIDSLHGGANDTTGMKPGDLIDNKITAYETDGELCRYDNDQMTVLFDISSEVGNCDWVDPNFIVTVDSILVDGVVRKRIKVEQNNYCSGTVSGYCVVEGIGVNNSFYLPGMCKIYGVEYLVMEKCCRYGVEIFEEKDFRAPSYRPMTELQTVQKENQSCLTFDLNGKQVPATHSKSIVIEDRKKTIVK